MWHTPLFRILALAAVLYALAAQLLLVFNGELNFDECYNLQIPLNLHLTGQYQSWYGGPNPFDYHITTGPPILVPIAIVFLLFRPGYVVARLVMTAFLMCYFWACYRVISAVDGRRSHGAFAISVVLLALVPGGIWTASKVLGEVPALCFFLLAILLMSRALATERAVLALSAGAALGMAVLSKLVLALCVAGFFLALPCAAEWRGRWRLFPRLVGLCGIGLLVPVAVWEGVKLSAMGWAEYQSYQSRTWHFMKFAGSGARLDTFDAAKGLFAHCQALAYALGLPPGVVELGLALAALVLGWTFLVERRPFAFGSLMLATVVFWVWWFRFSSWLSYRHLLPGYFLYTLLVASVGVIIVRDPRRGRVARGILLAGLIGGALLLIPPRRSTLPLERSPQLVAQQRAASVIRNIQATRPAALFWAPGWNQAPDLSFLTQTPFRNLARERPLETDDNYLVTSSPAKPHVESYAQKHCARRFFQQGGLNVCQLPRGAPRIAEPTSVP